MKKTRKGKKREKERVGVAETTCCHNALSDMVKFLKALFFFSFSFVKLIAKVMF